MANRSQHTRAGHTIGRRGCRRAVVVNVLVRVSAIAVATAVEAVIVLCPTPRRMSLASTIDIFFLLRGSKPQIDLSISMSLEFPVLSFFRFLLRIMVFCGSC